MTWNEFFLWGQNPANDVEADIYMGVMQPKNTLYFLGEYATGVEIAENSTTGVLHDILLISQVARFFSYRNTLVDNGLNKADYRAFVSQNTIKLKTINDARFLDIRYIKALDIYQSQKHTTAEVKL